MIVLQEAVAPSPVEEAVKSFAAAAAASGEGYTVKQLQEMVLAGIEDENELHTLSEAFFSHDFEQDLLTELSVGDRARSAVAATGKTASSAAKSGVNAAVSAGATAGTAAAKAAEKSKAAGMAMIEKARHVGISKERKDRWLAALSGKISSLDEKIAAISNEDRGNTPKKLALTAYKKVLEGIKRLVESLPIRKGTSEA